ncbi:2-keto-3-deoxygluconate permease [Candidatus Epulonipiscium fishelsonii]|uniref:2-keto-3-deoxygluconate permease n=1 Tax=Candidatus Epulonipiscium fishelsonii TaxID=77094 RepID=A0ACC8XGJ2_9FIRM|nr:2-keto-3-deoxygluconate permease [Epulopiscium sp. SCG-B05WGA-EpuloA1]ONI42746.1 2-keto-3-deoxygluconate permease [Epulopiscium sp. SCG-B11WGA-EpuloA1]
MPILKTVKKVPGGIMVVPLLIGAIINTFFPEILNIGGFTTALFKTSASAGIGMFLFCNGAQINVREAGSSVAKGTVLTLVKFIIGAGLGLFIGSTFGMAGVFGLTPLAVIASITNSNGGLYAALAGQYGDSTDVGAISILSINDGPFFTMVALGASGLAEIPFISLIASILPIIIGFILGNLDEDLREFLKAGTVITIPFFAFPLGAGLNLFQLASAGVAGIVLGLLCTLVTGIAGYYAMKLMKSKKPAVGAAVGTTAGNAAGTPAALAEIDPNLAAVAPTATVQVAAAIIVTAICCPLLVAYLDKLERKKCAN